MIETKLNSPERSRWEPRVKELENIYRKFLSERENIKPLLGMDQLRVFLSTIWHIEKTTTITNQSKKNKIITIFQKFFKTNGKTKDTEIKIQIKSGHLPSKQKTRPIPCHLQSFAEKEIRNLFQFGHSERLQNVDGKSFQSTVVLTVKKDKSVEIVLDSRK